MLLEIQYVGEHLLPGKIGHILVLLSFFGSLLSAFAYFKSTKVELQPEFAQKVDPWRVLGRGSFVVHTLSVIGIFGVLYYIITNHLFEYQYAWQHSSRSLPMEYLLSSFWEGQQGSFLLWSFWNSILGLVLIKTAKSLENRTMFVVSVVQALLASMVLGFYLSPDVQIGQTPFGLLRDHMQNAPIFSQPNYLELIGDGNGLNILLQNYWMVIHPPILFLGFAATLFPFAYIIAALWKGDYQSFVKPAINWTLFAGASLGLGIMMGGAWAYESLTFGGYWAWDPVENASLVPWLILVAGLHTLIVFKATGRSFIITAILLLLSYLFVWYSTFLTRTGVLGDTSVHAFTGEGKSIYWHLLIDLGILILMAFVPMIARWKQLPRVKTEEQTNTREFWMFLGSIILLLSALQIIIMTSLPVWAPLAKTITGKDIAPPVDVVAEYNKIQIWVAILVGIFSGFALFLKYKTTSMAQFWKRIGLSAGISIVLTGLVCFFQEIYEFQYILMALASFFGLVGSAQYLFSVQKAQLKKAGAAITHIGFAMILIGVLISSYKKEVISTNTLGKIWDFGKGDAGNIKESRENVLMYKDVPVVMGDYKATYIGDTVGVKSNTTYYRTRVAYEHLITGEKFELNPDAFLNPKGMEGGLSANPDSRHYWNKDIFTYITSTIDPTKLADTNLYHSHTVKPGDSIFLNNGYMVFKGFEKDPKFFKEPTQSNDVAVAAVLEVRSFDSLMGIIYPQYTIRDARAIQTEDTLSSMKVMGRIERIIPETGSVELMIKQKDRGMSHIVLKAIVFPYINVLWLGVIIMVIGFIIGMMHRIKTR